jgi:hypothetical protein
MKWPTLLLICGIALAFDACQRHSVQELQQLQPAHGAEAGAKSGEGKNNPTTGETKP